MVKKLFGWLFRHKARLVQWDTGYIRIYPNIGISFRLFGCNFHYCRKHGFIASKKERW